MEEETDDELIKKINQSQLKRLRLKSQLEKLDDEIIDMQIKLRMRSFKARDLINENK